MADIRCPMCGKPNPEDAKACRYCQAALKPLDSSQPVPGSSADNDLPDWIRQMRTPEEGPLAPPSAGAPDLPDWLTQIRQQNEGQTAPLASDAVAPTPPLGAASAGDAELPDWLKEIRPQSSAPAQGEDWLNQLRGSDLSSGAEQAAEPPAPSTAAGKPGSENDDWLKQFGAWETPPGVPPAEVSSKAAAGETPAIGSADWLASLRRDDEVPARPAPQEDLPWQEQTGTGQPGQDLNEWLAGLPDELPAKPAPPAAPSQASAPFKELPDWLSAPATPQSSNVPPTQPPQQPPIASSANIADWLSELDAWDPTKPAEGAQPQQPPAAPAPSADSSLDWLRSPDSGPAGPTPALSGQAAPETPAPAESSDWLKRIDAQGSPEQSAQPADSSGTPETPDWLKAFEDLPGAEPLQAPAPASSADIPDWLKAFENESLGETPPAVPSAAQAEETPQWLKPFKASTAELETRSGASLIPPTPPTTEPAAANTDSDMPVKGEAGSQDWLMDSEPQAATPAPAANQPSDWLQAFQQEVAQTEPAQPVESAALTAAETPDWLKQFQNESAGGTQAEAFSPIPAPESDELDWLKEFEAESAEPSLDSQGSQAGQTGPGTTQERPVESQPAAGETPDWLKNFALEASDSGQQPPSIPPTVPLAPEPAGVFEGQDLPDWLSKVDSTELGLTGTQAFVEEETPAAEIPTELISPFASSDIPDWLSESSVPPQGTGTGEQPAEGEEELAPAMMPQWLQAMRPVDAVMTPSTSGMEVQHIEKAGPLAGIQGILPAAETAAQYRKPPTYSIKLHMTDKQRSQVDLLDELISSESLPQEIRPEGLQAPQRLVRMAVGLILIIVVWLTSSMGSGIPSGINVSPETQQFYNQLNSIPAGSPVLVAVEYEPGFAGEMNLTSSAVLQNLIANDARLTFVSSNPAGPVLGEDLLNSVLTRMGSQASAYNLKERKANLGYLAGGIASLQEFARAPRQAVPYGFSLVDGEVAWNSAALHNVSRLSDFAGVIVLTGSPEIGRAWVEQVQPALKPGSMLLVSTAQAAPLLQPYANAAQAGGLVAGYSGGMAFEKLSNLSGTRTSTWWSAYQSGLFLGIVFILLGVIFQIFILLGNRRKA